MQISIHLITLFFLAAILSSCKHSTHASRILNLEDKISEFESQTSELRCKVSELENEKDNLKIKLCSVEVEFHDVLSEMISLESEIDDFSYGNWKDNVPEVVERFNDLKSAVSDFESEF